MGDEAAANPDDIFEIPNYDNPAWGRTPCGSMDIACHYLYVIDNLLDPSHVAWVHVSSFAGAGTGNPPLDIAKLDDGNLPDDAFLNISYNFMTPIDADNTRCFWFRHRNSDPDNQEISTKMFEGAKQAFIEDRDVLTEVHKGMKTSRTRHINLGIDAGAMRFRKMVERRIERQSDDFQP